MPSAQDFCCPLDLSSPLHSSFLLSRVRQWCSGCHPMRKPQAILLDMEYRKGQKPVPQARVRRPAFVPQNVVCRSPRTVAKHSKYLQPSSNHSSLSVLFGCLLRKSAESFYHLTEPFKHFTKAYQTAKNMNSIPRSLEHGDLFTISVLSQNCLCIL